MGIACCIVFKAHVHATVQAACRKPRGTDKPTQVQHSFFEQAGRHDAEEERTPAASSRLEC